VRLRRRRDGLSTLRNTQSCPCFQLTIANWTGSSQADFSIGSAPQSTPSSKIMSGSEGCSRNRGLFVPGASRSGVEDPGSVNSGSRSHGPRRGDPKSAGERRVATGRTVGLEGSISPPRFIDAAGTGLRATVAKNRGAAASRPGVSVASMVPPQEFTGFADSAKEVSRRPGRTRVQGTLR